jgi:predicted metal-dependent peptidase
MHMLMNHTRRLGQFPRDIANQAEDLSINAKLQAGFPEIRWVPSLREVGLSFKQGDIERYAKLAEETIARELMEKRKDQKGGNQQQQGGGKSGKSGSSAGGNGQPQKGQGDQSEGGQDGGEKDWDNNHTVALEDLIDTLNENGLGEVLEKLELPQDSSDVEKIGQIEEGVRLKDIDAIQKAAAQKAQMGGKYPGAHIVDSCAELVKGFTEGKLQWRLGLKNFLFGEGMRFQYTEAEPGDLYYVDPKDMGMNLEIFIGADLPHRPEEIVLCLIDTSGSVSQEMLRSFMSEIFNLKRENAGIGDTASEVVVISADTVVRGTAVEITESNVDELMDSGVGLSGRGGTDLANDLRQTMKLPLFEDKKISSVVFFTDLCDTPPKQSDFPSKLPLCFITTPHMMSEEFAKAVKDFARVYPIEEGIQVDLTADHLSTPQNTRKTKVG